MLTLLASLVCGHDFVSAAAAPGYVIDASWFKDRYSAQEWADTLDTFKAMGGREIWQRGVPFRRVTENDLLCVILYSFCFGSFPLVSVLLSRVAVRSYSRPFPVQTTAE